LFQARCDIIHVRIDLALASLVARRFGIGRRSVPVLGDGLAIDAKQRRDIVLVQTFAAQCTDIHDRPHSSQFCSLPLAMVFFHYPPATQGVSFFLLHGRFWGRFVAIYDHFKMASHIVAVSADGVEYSFLETETAVDALGGA